MKIELKKDQVLLTCSQREVRLLAVALSNMSNKQKEILKYPNMSPSSIDMNEKVAIKLDSLAQMILREIDFIGDE